MRPVLISLDEAAKLLGTSVRYVRQLINRGHLKPERIGRRVFVDKQDCWMYKAKHPRLGEQCSS